MELIDWPALVRNALWVVGLSVALAAGSYNRWWAAVHGQSFRQVLDRPAFMIPFAGGMLLLAISLSWGALRGWERLLWAGLGLAFAWELAVAVRSAGRAGRRPA